MKKYLYCLFSLMLLCSCSKDAQKEDTITEETNELYFPPINSDDWQNISPTTLEWNTNKEQDLKDFLKEKDTDAFIILKDGKIVTEWYFGDFTATDNHSWNSAAKTLKTVLIGIAQEEGFLSINEASSKYLGSGWSSLTPEQEDNITIRHHLTMTTGLDYTVENNFCSDKECLIYKNEPGSYWYYHNATYSLIDEIISEATNNTFNNYFNSMLKNKIGMQGAWINAGYLHLYQSTARSMARFGLLNLNNGIWDKKIILSDENYLSDMKNTSQEHNKSYGYLWWLNGKDSFKLPSSDDISIGKLIPSAPDDLYAGLGANDQKLYIIPSEQLVIVRMGSDASGTSLASSSFDELLWQKINAYIK